MVAHSSVLAWRIPGMGEPGGLSSMGSHRVGHDWSDLAAAAAAVAAAGQKGWGEEECGILKKTPGRSCGPGRCGLHPRHCAEAGPMYTDTTGPSQVVPVVKNPHTNAGDARDDPWVGKIPWRRKMATYSSIVAWEVPWTEEPGRLQSMKSPGVGHDWAAKQARTHMQTLYS